ncbi:uncharacterized protein LOC135702690 [Ochlerotatus camptorhynchus]|uniref:uncharacterized protein LOC135702690 n=1 Tax=Ochlerotatus camptorhynchus TaxID=644619 RepID=UPI0031E00427
MEHFVNTIVAINGFDTGRDLLKLFALSNNYNKIAAYQKLTKKKIGRVLALILLDMQSMERTELKYDPLVPEAIKQLYNDTFNFFPKSLKDIRSCLNNVNIYQGSPDSKQCIVATNNQVEVKHPKFNNTLGLMKEVILNSTGCTSFRLELVNDMASVKIINAEGNALTNINAAVPGMTDFSFVGAPYTNSANMKLDSSQLWILDVSYKSDMIKIESEFNVYRTGQAWKSMDYLVYKNINGVNQPVVARWGMEGMLVGQVKNYAEWTFKCAS